MSQKSQTTTFQIVFSVNGTAKPAFVFMPRITLTRYLRPLASSPRRSLQGNPSNGFRQAHKTAHDAPLSRSLSLSLSLSHSLSLSLSLSLPFGAKAGLWKCAAFFCDMWLAPTPTFAERQIGEGSFAANSKWNLTTSTRSSRGSRRNSRWAWLGKTNMRILS